MNKDQISKWLVDITLFASFLLAFFLDLTGLEMHQWIGVAASGLAVYHLGAHWNWVCTVTERFFGKTSARARLYYLVDALILIGFYIIGLTGLVISTWLNLSLSNGDLWLQVHILVSIITLILTVAKIGLHWRWVATTTQKIFSPPGQPAQHESPAARPVPAAAASQQVSRRDFIKVMGIVGMMSALALCNAASGLRKASAGQSGAAQTSAEAAASSQQTRLDGSLETSGQNCSVRCERRCSYPGHCRRYTDANGNNLCDNGECV